MSQIMLRELLDALAAAEAGGVRMAVLRGSGGHFSAGADLHDMARAREAPIAHETDPMAAANAAFGHVCAAYSQSPLAIVAVLEGAVMGGGFGLACCADVAIASQTADFRLPETSLGLIPAQIAPFLVERLGYSEAKRIAVTGARFGAEEAYRIGLVHKVCASEAELEAALAAHAAANPRLRARRRRGDQEAAAPRPLGRPGEPRGARRRRVRQGRARRGRCRGLARLRGEAQANRGPVEALP